ncbi:hypothetical protein A0H81_09559 [Grifola frondosa]|uniref:DUF6593 domain-containing protein n=1 Tax=Grifola frondosa TaxID=5627 RepID=A0A1C7M1Y0_GRIFR|nr:hypothetical protein A0H81_09559 [Grifola frondosa]
MIRVGLVIPLIPSTPILRLVRSPRSDPEYVSDNRVAWIGKAEWDAKHISSALQADRCTLPRGRPRGRHVDPGGCGRPPDPRTGMPCTMSGPYVLLQFSADPWNARFEDLEGRLAFTVNMVEEDPNLIMRITREAQWAQQHPDIMGPSNSYFYFGPSRAQGYLVYGNSSTSQQMANARRQKKESSTSRYFTAQNGKEYKWRIAPQRFECVDGKGVVVATWETSQLEDEFHARITIKHAALAVVTEIITTLTLNRIAQVLNW